MCVAWQKLEETPSWRKIRHDQVVWNLWNSDVKRLISAGCFLRSCAEATATELLSSCSVSHCDTTILSQARCSNKCSTLFKEMYWYSKALFLTVFWFLQTDFLSESSKQPEFPWKIQSITRMSSCPWRKFQCPLGRVSLSSQSKPRVYWEKSCTHISGAFRYESGLAKHQLIHCRRFLLWNSI